MSFDSIAAQSDYAAFDVGGGNNTDRGSPRPTLASSFPVNGIDDGFASAINVAGTTASPRATGSTAATAAVNRLLLSCPSPLASASATTCSEHSFAAHVPSHGLPASLPANASSTYACPRHRALTDSNSPDPLEGTTTSVPAEHLHHRHTRLHSQQLRRSTGGQASTALAEGSQSSPQKRSTATARNVAGPVATVRSHTPVVATAAMQAGDEVDVDGAGTTANLPRLRRLPSILQDSWEFRKVASQGSVLPNALVCLDVDGDDVEECIVGTTEGVLLVMKPDCRAPIFSHSLSATISVVLYSDEHRRLVLITLEGQCEVLDNFLVPTSSSGNSGTANKRPATPLDPAAPPPLQATATAPTAGLSPQRTSHTNLMMDAVLPANNTRADGTTCRPTSVFHVPSNCFCGDLGPDENGTDRIFLGSYDRRLYVYSVSGVCLLSLYMHRPIASVKAVLWTVAAADRGNGEHRPNKSDRDAEHTSIPLVFTATTHTLSLLRVGAQDLEHLRAVEARRLQPLILAEAAAPWPIRGPTSANQKASRDDSRGNISAAAADGGVHSSRSRHRSSSGGAVSAVTGGTLKVNEASGHGASSGVSPAPASRAAGGVELRAESTSPTPTHTHTPWAAGVATGELRPTSPSRADGATSAGKSVHGGSRDTDITPLAAVMVHPLWHLRVSEEGLCVPPPLRDSIVPFPSPSSVLPTATAGAGGRGSDGTTHTHRSGSGGDAADESSSRRWTHAKSTAAAASVTCAAAAVSRSALRSGCSTASSRSSSADSQRSSLSSGMTLATLASFSPLAATTAATGGNASGVTAIDGQWPLSVSGYADPNAGIRHLLATSASRMRTDSVPHEILPEGSVHTPLAAIAQAEVDRREEREGHQDHCGTRPVGVGEMRAENSINEDEGGWECVGRDSAERRRRSSIGSGTGGASSTGEQLTGTRRVLPGRRRPSSSQGGVVPPSYPLPLPESTTSSANSTNPIGWRQQTEWTSVEDCSDGVDEKTDDGAALTLSIDVSASERRLMVVVGCEDGRAFVLSLIAAESENASTEAVTIAAAVPHSAATNAATANPPAPDRAAREGRPRHCPRGRRWLEPSPDADAVICGGGLPWACQHHGRAGETGKGGFHRPSSHHRHRSRGHRSITYDDVRVPFASIAAVGPNNSNTCYARQHRNNVASTATATSAAWLSGNDDGTAAAVALLRVRCAWAGTVGGGPLLQRTRMLRVAEDGFCAVFVTASGVCVAVDPDTRAAVEYAVLADGSSFTLSVGPPVPVELPPLPGRSGCSTSLAAVAGARMAPASSATTGNGGAGAAPAAPPQVALGRPVSCVCVCVDELSVYAIGDTLLTTVYHQRVRTATAGHASQSSCSTRPLQQHPRTLTSAATTAVAPATVVVAANLSPFARTEGWGRADEDADRALLREIGAALMAAESSETDATAAAGDDGNSTILTDSELADKEEEQIFFARQVLANGYSAAEWEALWRLLLSR